MKNDDEDTRELRKTIATLQQQLKQSRAVDKVSATIHEKVVEKPVLTDGQLARAEKLIAQIDGVITRYVERFEKVVHRIEDAGDSNDGALAELRTIAETLTDAIANTTRT